MSGRPTILRPIAGGDAPVDLFQGKIPVVTSEKDKEMKVVDMVPTSLKGKYKVLRGGSWKGDPFSTATYHRKPDWANYASDFYGFRCAGDAPGQGNRKVSMHRTFDTCGDDIWTGFFLGQFELRIG